MRRIVDHTGLGWLLLLLTACGSESAPAEPEAPPPQTANNACLPRVNPNPGPVTDPGGPYYHQVVVGNSVDGGAVSNARQILEHASVPDGVLMRGGNIYIYYVNGAEGNLWVAEWNWVSARPLATVGIDGISGPLGVVDPDAWVMADGRVRLAYLSGFGPPQANVRRAICIAESSDGWRFENPRVALELRSDELMTDPSIVQLRDGSWRMAISLGQQTVLARSTDGISFTRYSSVGFGGVPELALARDGRLRLLVCRGGIESYISGDGGQTWTAEGVVVPPGSGGRRIVCDPSVVHGTDVFIYKTG